MNVQCWLAYLTLKWHPYIFDETIQKISVIYAGPGVVVI